MSKRLAWYLFTIPLVVVLVVAAFKLIGLSVTTQAAINAFNNGQFERSIEQSESLMDFNVIEPYIPYFNRGDAYAASEMFVESIDDFERALELAPEQKKCDVRVNLALSWENLGDIYAEGGFFQGAVLLYEASQAVLDDAGPECDPPEKQQQVDDADERVQEKKQDALDQLEAQPPQDGDGEQSEQEQQLQQLEEQQQQAAQEKADQESGERGEQSGGYYTDKPW